MEELYARQLARAEIGMATPLGEINRLRGYPTNCIYDSNTNFLGAEFRWYGHEVQDEFNFVLEKVTFAGIQIAFFLRAGNSIHLQRKNLAKNE